MENQYRSQLASVVEFVVYREGDVGNALSLMAEVQAKLNEVLSSSNHLEMIAARANTELEVLLLTKRVAEARSQLAEAASSDVSHGAANLTTAESDGRYRSAPGRVGDDGGRCQSRRLAFCRRAGAMVSLRDRGLLRDDCLRHRRLLLIRM